MTVAEAISQLGLRDDDAGQVCLAVIDREGAARHYRIGEVADAEPTEAAALYVASGLFAPGSVGRHRGRSTENVARVVYLPFDCDLADWMGFPPPERKDERAAEFAWLWGLPQDELDDLLAAQRQDIERTFAAVGLPIHVLLCSGYGHYALVRIADADQHRAVDAKDAHKLLVQRLNEAGGGRLVDRQVSDAGTRIFRVPGSLNRKGPIARPVTILHNREGSCPLGQRPKAPRPAAAFVPRSGAGLSEADATAVVDALKPWWSPGLKHALAVAIPGMLAKAGVPEDQAYDLMERISDHGDRPQERRGGVATSYARARSGANLSGYAGLRDRIDPDALAFVDGVLERYRRATVPPTPIIRPVDPATDEPPRYQPPPEIAFRGWFGEYRDLMSPTTEAPDAFHLGSAYVVVGNELGRRAFTYYGNPTYGNVFGVLVGPTGQARKDTAMSRALSLVVAGRSDPLSLPGSVPEKPTFHTTFDVTSSEGLIAVLAAAPNTLLYMTELSMLLQRGRRQSTSTLLTMLIKLWDAPDRVDLPTRNEPIVAENTFLSILTATTPDTLAADIQPSDIASGFANRFLFFGGEGIGPKASPPKVDKAHAARLIQRLRTTFVRYDGSELNLDDEARERWIAWYEAYYRWELANDEERQMVQRLGANIHKLALLYAAAEGADAIELPHLDAAIAVVEWSWSYVRGELNRWGQEQDAKIAGKIEAVLQRKGPLHKRAVQQAMGQRLGPGTFMRVYEAMVKGGRLDVDPHGIVSLGTGGDVAETTGRREAV